MNLADLSIKRPVTVTCAFIVVIVAGLISFNKIGVDLYPDVSFPIVVVSTYYPGAGPNEIETLVTKPIEDELSLLPGLKSIESTNKEGISSIIVQFTLETDVNFAEQQVKDKVTSLEHRLPDDIEKPVIQTYDPSDAPILVLSLTADLSPAELHDMAVVKIRPLIEQIPHVGFVQVSGGQKREIHVELDRRKLKNYRLSATQVADRIGAVGQNVPGGKIQSQRKETLIRTLGEFESIKDIKGTIVSFYGNEVPVRVGDVATVEDSLAEKTGETYVNGKKSLSLSVMRQSGANTLAVSEEVKERVKRINTDFSKDIAGFHLAINRDGGKPIRANVDDVIETIAVGILLTVVVVFFFLGNIRSTFITGIAIPNSLIAAFILMLAAGFTLNVMSLLAMSLAVGLLIDDAIVVRENIFRHIEMGKPPRQAALEGTHEVKNAVIATTLTVLAVFGPIAFMEGMVGQFFKEFGLTICFIIIVSTVDALTLAPMLSAYFAGKNTKEKKSFIGHVFHYPVEQFDRFHTWLENKYGGAIRKTLQHPILVILVTLVICGGSIGAAILVPKTFVPPQDTGEFSVLLEMPAGTTLEAMDETASDVDKKLREQSEVAKTVLTVGGRNGETNEAQIFIQLVPFKERNMNTSGFKKKTRAFLTAYHELNPRVVDQSGGGAQQPITVNISGTDLKGIEDVARTLYDKLKTNTDLLDVDINYRGGTPEFQIIPDKKRADELGISTNLVGREVRTLIEGSKPAVFRANGEEYDIRVRLREEDRNLKDNYKNIYVPNINQRLVRLADMSTTQEIQGPATIYRKNRGRYVQVSADLNPSGKGMANAISAVHAHFKTTEGSLPPGVRYELAGQAQDFQDMAESFIFAAVIALLLIYLVLAGLYESYITPFTIMLVIPLATCGAIYGLAVTGKTLDIFSIIGCVLLLGIATKNSILLIDYIEQLEKEGKSRSDAIITAGRVRLRPILMTAFSLIAGMLPLAIGLNEASSQRTSMGVAVIGGTITSTFLTLLVVPAAYSYIERFREWSHRHIVEKVVTQS